MSCILKRRSAMKYALSFPCERLSVPSYYLPFYSCAGETPNWSLSFPLMFSIYLRFAELPLAIISLMLLLCLGNCK
ncbi:hypothetical protein BDV28DRAFT_66915 [Aspergillus coremiiformis]|uniref:Uncharacterized protein n=1 Tax=Aspergillus coremiiformis TaxID=138285 RepID=A0A5N6YUR2_9EURO|nr:hypothetical protein BDV28DRAFT_66915 [Aspergillus coremiiformis]